MSHSHSEEEVIAVNQEKDNFVGSSVVEPLDRGVLEPTNVPSASPSSFSDATQDEDDHSVGNLSNPFVLHYPNTSGPGQIDEHGHLQHQSRVRSSNSDRVLPSVGTYAVQCAKCFKWRLVPTKAKYEELREHILGKPFFCETAREWRPEVSCDDPPDLTQDGSRLWAIDKPNIAQSPPGWQRLLRIRGEGSTKFADVYYQAPSGKRLRSMVEIQKYLMEHPEYMLGGVTLSQFSFQIPKPLRRDYVRKRPPKVTPRPSKPIDAKPLACAMPDGPAELQLGKLTRPVLASSDFDTPNEPSKKKSRLTSPENSSNTNPDTPRID